MHPSGNHHPPCPSMSARSALHSQQNLRLDQRGSRKGHCKKVFMVSTKQPYAEPPPAAWSRSPATVCPWSKAVKAGTHMLSKTGFQVPSSSPRAFTSVLTGVAANNNPLDRLLILDNTDPMCQTIKASPLASPTLSPWRSIGTILRKESLVSPGFAASNDTRLGHGACCWTRTPMTKSVLSISSNESYAARPIQQCSWVKTPPLCPGWYCNSLDPTTGSLPWWPLGTR